jgi:glycoprotein 6-alpha-L-fucosyltransferase
MFYVNNYYEKIALKGYSGEKPVYISSDDNNVMEELKQKYKGFKFVDKNHYFQDSKVNNSIYSVENLMHTIIDIHFLSLSDYLVCTMSSNVRNSNKNIKIYRKITKYSAVRCVGYLTS